MLSLSQVHRALLARCAVLHAQGGARAREWLLSLEGFRMRLHWRCHNLQVGGANIVGLTLIW